MASNIQQQEAEVPQHHRRYSWSHPSEQSSAKGQDVSFKRTGQAPHILQPTWDVCSAPDGTEHSRGAGMPPWPPAHVWGCVPSPPWEGGGGFGLGSSLTPLRRPMSAVTCPGGEPRQHRGGRGAGRGAGSSGSSFSSLCQQQTGHLGKCPAEAGNTTQLQHSFSCLGKRKNRFPRASLHRSSLRSQKHPPCNREGGKHKEPVPRAAT